MQRILSIITSALMEAQVSHNYRDKMLPSLLLNMFTRHSITITSLCCTPFYTKMLDTGEPREGTKKQFALGPSLNWLLFESLGSMLF